MRIGLHYGAHITVIIPFVAVEVFHFANNGVDERSEEVSWVDLEREECLNSEGFVSGHVTAERWANVGNNVDWLDEAFVEFFEQAKRIVVFAA